MAAITGTNGNDRLFGASEDDSIDAQAGDDIVWAGSGNDTLIGGAGNDYLGGDSGTDWIEGGAGTDTLDGGGEMDHFVFREFGAANADSLVNFASDWDDLQLDAAAFGAIGAAGRFETGDARFYSAAGATAGHDADDRIVFDPGTGRLWYDADGNGAGAAQLIATVQSGGTVIATDITVFGSSGGGQTINGTAGDDSLTGGDGNDTISGFAGNDTLRGAGGDDSLDGGDGNDDLRGDDGNDVLTGGAGNDVLTGDAGDDSLSGGNGDDTLIRGGDGSAHDVLDGGLGNDLYDLSGDGDQFTLLDAGGIDTLVVRGGTLPSGFENMRLVDFTGSGAAATGNELDNWIRGDIDGDRISGLAGNDTLEGNGGADTLDGGDGNDWLAGGSGADVLTGGAGTDAFSFLQAGAAVADSIADFVSGADKIHLDASNMMNQLGVSGSFVAGDPRFWSAPGATAGHDADDRVIFDTSTGRLFYDGDGSGAGAALLIATVQSDTTVTATDIIVDNGSAPPPPIVGTEGDDTLTGTDGNDVIEGLGGSDTLDGKGGNDTLSGGADFDRFVLDQAPGAPNADTITDFQVNLDDIVLDLAAMPALGASGPFANGDARFFAGAGATGGHDADDRVVYDTSSGQLFYDADGNGAGAGLLLAALQGGVAISATDIVVTGEAPPANTITGTEGNDSLVGTEGNDTILGLGGSDNIEGRGGDDWLSGGPADDTISGGGGADAFVFDAAPGTPSGPSNSDTILDFASSSDRILLDVKVMQQLGADGAFTANDGRFFAAPGAFFAQDADDRIVYNSTDGALYYDQDGSGSVFPQLIATLQGAPTLAATDIVVFGGADPGPGVGGPGDDVFVGTEGDDVFDGRGGNDRLEGRGGNDTLVGGEGSDVLIGGDGNDYLQGIADYEPLFGNPVADTMDGGLGDDTYLVTPNDVISDAGGIDTIRVGFDWTLGAGFENLVLIGGAFANGTGNDLDNSITGNAGINWIDGGDGNDILVGGGGGDHFLFAAGSGDYGHDQIDGGADAGIDELDFTGAHSSVVADLGAGTVVGGGVGGSGSATLVSIESVIGGGFDDRLTAAAGGSELSGGGGNDSLFGGAGNDQLSGGAGDDQVSGGAGNDVFFASEGSDQLQGEDGDDVFEVAGADFNGNRFDGGAGTDEVIFIPSDDGLVIDLGAGTMTLGTQSAVLLSVDNAFSGDGDDVLIGTAGANLLSASGGSDTLRGGAGIDTLFGGTQSDQFVFDVAPGASNADQITDFTSGTDQIHLDATVMDALGAGGRFADGDVRFWAAAGATAGHDADDRVVFDTSTGRLIYDADGNGAGSAQLVATVQAGASVAATDIVVDNGGTSPPPGSIVGTDGNDTLWGTAGEDNITALGGDDIVWADSGDDTVIGGAGSDYLGGDSGADWIEGGAGADTLDGGGDRDHFVFRESGASNADSILNFASDWDDLRLDGAAFGAIGAAGRFEAGDDRFYAADGVAAGHDASDRMVYDTDGGNLYYDADGSGPGAAQLVASLQGAPELVATDITVV